MTVSLRESPASTKCSSTHGQVKLPPQDCQARGTHHWTHTWLIYIHVLQCIAYPLLAAGVTAAAAYKNTVQFCTPRLQDGARNVLVLSPWRTCGEQYLQTSVGFINLLCFSARSQSSNGEHTQKSYPSWHSEGKGLVWWAVYTNNILFISSAWLDHSCLQMVNTLRNFIPLDTVRENSASVVTYKPRECLSPNQEQTTTRDALATAWDTPQHHWSTTLGLRMV